MSSEKFIILILLALENYRNMNPWYLAGYHTKLNVNCCYEVLSLKALVVRLKPKVNVIICLQKWNLKVTLKRNNLTFLRKIAIQNFVCFQNTRLIYPLFCEFLFGNYVWSQCSSFAPQEVVKVSSWLYLICFFIYCLLLVLNGTRDINNIFVIQSKWRN